MSKEDKETYCSQLARYYFDTNFKKYVKGELSGSYIAVTVIEDLCENGIRSMSTEDLISKVAAADPSRSHFLEGRAERMIDFCKNPGEKWPCALLEDKGGIITIL